MTTKCPCCGNKKIKTIYSGLYDKSYFVKGKFTLVKCQKCNFEFINPLLNEKELEKYYPSTDYYSFKNENKLGALYHKISAYYHSKRNPLFNLIIYPFSSLLYTYHIGKENKGMSVLEIGCGNGSTLEKYKEYGLITQDIEPHGPKLSKQEKDLGILRKKIGSVNFPKDKFDYVILKEVLEHIPNQEIVLKKCHKWLKPGGKLIITLPNTNSWWCRKFKENWFGYDAPRHLYNYNPKNISFFLRKFGFKVNNVRVYDSSYMLVGSLKFHSISKIKKKKDPIIFSSFFKALFTPVSLLSTYMNRGSLMEIECEK